MAGFDLLNLQPTVITRDLRNKFVLIAAEFKYGKTTLMAAIPGSLILSFEPGLNAKAGVNAVKINKWSDMKLILAELSKPEVQEKYTTICFDTVTIAAELCTEYICAKEGVESLGDVPYGKLYDKYEREFGKVLRKIAMLGYGIIFASHVEAKQVKYKGKDIERIQPQLDKRAFKIINGLVDIIGIGVINYDENDKPERLLFTGKSPYMAAGTRFTYFPSVVPFGYREITDALSDAIEREGQASGTGSVIDGIINDNIDDIRSFEEVVEEARVVWNQLIEKSEGNAEKVYLMTERIFGKRKKLSEITEYEQEQFETLLDRMKDLLVD